MHLSTPKFFTDSKIRGRIDSCVQLELNSPNPDNLIATLSKDDNSFILSNQTLMFFSSMFIGDKVWLIMNNVFEYLLTNFTASSV